jgi:hypothetical protein
VSGELQKTKVVETMHFLNATADMNTQTSTLIDFKAKKTWAWTDKQCVSQPFNGGPAIGFCMVDSDQLPYLSKLQAGSVGPFPAQWWKLSDPNPADTFFNATLISSQSSNLTSLAELVRTSLVHRNAQNDAFVEREYQDFKTGPQSDSLFVLPAQCPQ